MKGGHNHNFPNQLACLWVDVVVVVPADPLLGRLVQLGEGEPQEEEPGPELDHEKHLIRWSSVAISVVNVALVFEVDGDDGNGLVRVGGVYQNFTWKDVGVDRFISRILIWIKAKFCL